MSYDVRFLKGIGANYAALKEANQLDKNTFYYVDESDLYLGEILLSNADEIASAVASIELNAKAIKTLQDELDALVDPDGEGGGSISTQINTLRDELTAKINANTKAITDEEARAKGIESGLRTDVDALEKDLSDLQTLVETNETDIEGKVSALTETVGTNTDSISGLSTLVSTLDGKVSTAEGDIDTLQGDVLELDAIIDTLVGTDVDLSVREIAIDELTKKLITDDAAENLNSLEEIAAWIQSHPEDAATMNAAILANTKSIEDLVAEQDLQDADIKAVEDAITAINHAETGILAQANSYTDTQVGLVAADISEIDSAIAALQGEVEAIKDDEEGILAQAKAEIESAIAGLGLGTAAYEDASAFEVAGAAATAEANAKAYTDSALSWGTIPEAATV